QDKEMYKLSIAVLLGCFVAAAWSEKCPSGLVSDCIHTTCSTGAELHCVDGLCTCNSPQRKCITRDDCLAITDWNCREQDRHCVDNLCVCGRI
uniref:EB domain-containing protein n=2 Tax=Magallana gigas TaxID=29159 RepID=A0A8W8N4P2_MAGGI